MIKLPANAQCSFTAACYTWLCTKHKDVIGIVWLLAMLVYKEDVHILSLPSNFLVCYVLRMPVSNSRAKRCPYYHRKTCVNVCTQIHGHLGNNTVPNYAGTISYALQHHCDVQRHWHAVTEYFTSQKRRIREPSVNKVLLVTAPLTNMLSFWVLLV